VLTAFFAIVLWVIILDMLRVSARVLRGEPVPPSSEADYVPLGSVAAQAQS